MRASSLTGLAGLTLLAAFGCTGGGKDAGSQVHANIVAHHSATATLDGEPYVLMGSCNGVRVPGVCSETWVRVNAVEDKANYPGEPIPQHRIDSIVWSTPEACERELGVFSLDPCADSGWVAWRQYEESLNTKVVWHYADTDVFAQSQDTCATSDDCADLSADVPWSAHDLNAPIDSAETQAALDDLIASPIAEETDADGTWALVATCDIRASWSRCFEHWERTDHVSEPTRGTSGLPDTDRVTTRRADMTSDCYGGELSTDRCPTADVVGESVHRGPNHRRVLSHWTRDDGSIDVTPLSGPVEVLSPPDQIPEPTGVP